MDKGEKAVFTSNEMMEVSSGMIEVESQEPKEQK
jgi:hypothetical protein